MDRNALRVELRFHTSDTARAQTTFAPASASFRNVDRPSRPVAWHHELSTIGHPAARRRRPSDATRCHRRRCDGRRTRRPLARCDQGVRLRRHRGARTERRDRGLPLRTLHSDHGSVGLRQVHPDALHGRPGHPDRGAGVHRRHRPLDAVGQAADAAASRTRGVRFSGVQPDPDAHRLREHHPASRPGRDQA